MKYDELVDKVEKVPYFHEAFLEAPFSQSLRNQLSRWVKQKKLIRLKRGLYTLPRHKLKLDVSAILISFIL